MPTVPRSSIVPDDGCAYTSREVISLAPDWARELLKEEGGRVEGMAFSRSHARKSKQHIVRAWTSAIPEGSFHQLNSGVLLSSVEFEFLILAGQVDIRQLIQFGNEICGRYTFDPTHKRGFRKRETPLTTKKRLASYLAGAAGCYGRKEAERALKYVTENSASPMESVVQMLLCLPRRLGGYGLPRPSMNFSVPLDSRAERIAQRTECIADLCYPTKHLDIEYHGEYDHDNEMSFISDRARVNGLLEMGYEVIELTYDQVVEFERFEAIALHVAKKLGVFLRPAMRGPIPERMALRRLALVWNRSSGEPG